MGQDAKAKQDRIDDATQAAINRTKAEQGDLERGLRGISRKAAKDARALASQAKRKVFNQHASCEESE